MHNVESGSELWSDFDGTAVETKGKTDIRNWLKYPLPMMDNYPDFLAGALAEGVEIGGIVSRRPNIGPRRKVTALSIANLGLQRYFENGSIVLAGSETAKAAHVVDRAKETQVGLIDDKPHKVGAEILTLMANSGEASFVTLGAVDHDRRMEYIQRLNDFAYDIEGAEKEDLVGRNFKINVGRSVLKVVELLPYSEESGAHFALHMQAK